MAIKKALFNIKGMTRDLAASKFSPEFAYENKNLRLIATDDNTSLALVNEKGNSLKNISWNGVVSEGDFVVGTPIGQLVLGDSLILYTAGEDSNITVAGTEVDDISISGTTGTTIDISTNWEDHIYKFWYQGNTLKGAKLFLGSLNFNKQHPIESIGVYENDSLQKIYWVDGINSPRVINIANSNLLADSSYFDFIPTLLLDEIGSNLPFSVTITKGTGGHFPGGVLQYCFTYSRKNGQESKIFYITELISISDAQGRGVSPDGYSTNSYTIGITVNSANPDLSRFDYLNIYSIIRTTENGTPIVKLLTRMEIATSTTSYSYLDTNMSGLSIDPTELLYKGGEELIAGTLEAKDNTLFLGNISTEEDSTETIDFSTHAWVGTGIDYTTLLSSYKRSSALNVWRPLLDNKKHKYLKKGNVYRVGIQLQDEKGAWSDPVFIEDYTASYSPVYHQDDDTVLIASAYVHIDSTGVGMIPSKYKRARAVIVFPTKELRGVVALGIICPTLYTPYSRLLNAPYALSSWFFRPFSCYNGQRYEQRGIPPIDPEGFSNRHSFEYRNNTRLPYNRYYNSECIYTQTDSPLTALAKNGVLTDFTNNKDFYIDSSILTFHSPDIDYLDDLDLLNVEMRVTGMFLLDSESCNVTLIAGTGKDSTVVNTIPISVTATALTTSSNQAPIGTSTAWYDKDNSSNLKYFGVYPWHKGTLNASTDSGKLSHKIITNFRQSQSFRYFSTAKWSSADTSVANGLADARVCKEDNTNSIALNLQSQSYHIGLNYNSLTYTALVEQLINPSSYKTGVASYNGGPLTLTSNSFTDPVSIKYFSPTHAILALNNTENNELVVCPLASFTGFGSFIPDFALVGGSSIYPSGSPFFLSGEGYSPKVDVKNEVWDPTDLTQYPLHDYTEFRIGEGSLDEIKPSDWNLANDDLVISERDGNGYILRAVRHDGLDYFVAAYGVDVPYWHDITNDVYGTMTPLSVVPRNLKETVIPLNNSDFTFMDSEDAYSDWGANTLEKRELMWIVELYRPSVAQQSPFGDTSKYTLQSHQWIPAGGAVTIDRGFPLSLPITEGDTTFGTYDCVKTLPASDTDINSIVEVMSFMCESYTDLGGRYDRYMGLSDYSFLSKSVGINLFNPVYNQRDNFFNYRMSSTDNTGFPNIITWSLPKTSGSEIDTWTQITLASTLELDGDKGPINAITKLNNDLIAFQDKGFSQILYNELTQLTTTTGIPIEIGNSGSVSGKRYISNSIGCSNKWSICKTPLGIYFADNLGKDIYLFNGQLKNLSDSLGFHSWVVNNLNDATPWNPYNFNNCVVYYDKDNADVMIITNDTCLSYSESLGQFSSFYDYQQTPYFALVGNRQLAVHKTPGVENYQLYGHREGNYNSFYGEIKPYWTTVIVNPDPTEDKIFNNLEYRADGFIGENYQSNYTFDHLNTWNEYQQGEALLTPGQVGSAPLKKKFRTWRALIPRNTSNKGGDSLHNYTRDRMRNPWLYLKLSMLNQDNLSGNLKHVLHDLVVDYFE